MIVVTGSNALDLRERDNFREFKVVVEASSLSAAQIGAVLSPIGRVDGDHAWVAPSSLTRWGGVEQSPQWQANLAKMVESVRRFGWVAEDGAVRAHIERTSAEGN